MRLRTAPRRWRGELRGLLLTEEQIARRVRRLGAQLAKDYAGRDLVVVALLKGTVMFLADLLRHLDFPLRLDFLGVSSYGAQTRPGRLQLTKDLDLPIKGREVLVVDDILDTGQTLAWVVRHLRSRQPARLRLCVLLNKQSRRQAPIRADYVGFEIPDFFVVGYGLDHAERHRNLPFIGVLK